MSLKCIIVDDEKLAQNVLEKYIQMLPSLHLLKKCGTGIEAISFLHEEDVELIFLDIDMPELSGLEMLKTLDKQPMVILTTAYAQYALESYEYGVIDYLLKPISFERFLKAVNKVVNRGFKKNSEIKNLATNTIKNSIMLKENGVVYNVSYNDILYVEAYGNYLNVYTKEKKYMVREKMHIIEKELPEELFLRVHKSYIISLNELTSLEGNRITIGGVKIPIGNLYKSKLISTLENK